MSLPKTTFTIAIEFRCIERKALTSTSYNSVTTQQSECRFYTTLRQACSLDIQRAQFAFKDAMIHLILQLTLLIASGYVLHRCTSQEIHRYKLYSVYFHFLYRLFLKERDEQQNQWYYWETVKSVLEDLRWLRTSGRL